MNIQVVSTDRFRKAFRSFREREQKQIDEGIRKFLIEPTNPSSNFEHLPFIDENLKSIRVSDNIRIILAMFDGIYFLLHVDNHDKAYKWGQNKRIDRNMISGAIRIYTDAVEILEKWPQKEDSEKEPIFSQCNKEQLKVIGVPEGWIEKILSVTEEEEYTELWNYLPDETIENLELVRNGFDIRNLVMRIQEEQEEQLLPVEKQAVIQEGLEPITEDQSLAEALKKDISVFRFYLHPSQKILIERDFNGPMKVTGTAGTGKTIAAIHRTKKLAENLPDGANPIFFTTFTKYLIRNISSIFREAAISEEKLVVQNLHSFAIQYSKELGLLDNNPNIISTSKEILKFWKQFCQSYFIEDYSPAFLHNEYRHVIQEKHITDEDSYLNVLRSGQGEALPKSKRKELWSVFNKFEIYQQSFNTLTFEDAIFRLNKYLELWPDLKPFSHVVCDEVQDFSNLELRLLRNLVPEGPNDLFLTGDPFQNIYQKKINFAQSGIQIRGKSFRLKINYRTTDEIQKTAFSALSQYEFNDFNAQKAHLPDHCESLVYGEKPQFLTFNNQEEEFAYMADYIRQNFGQMALHEICFATHRKTKRDELKSYLEENHITCINLENIKDLKETEGRVVLSTLHGLKGLEFKHLIIFNLSNETFPFIPMGFNKMPQEAQQEYLKSEYALLYVAFSRAISQLIVTGTGKKLEL